MRNLAHSAVLLFTAAIFATSGSLLCNANPGSQTSPLSLRLHVDSISPTKNDDKTAEFTLSCRLQFVNTTGQPAILYWHQFWIGGFKLSATEDDARAAKHFYDLEMWPSNYRNASWTALSSRISQPAPPSDLTRIIAPGASTEYATDVYLRFNKKSCSSCSEPFRDTVWKRIAAGDTRMWLQLALEGWPINLEERPSGNNVLGKNLRKKWRKYGVLQLENLVSTPTEIVLPAEPKKTVGETVRRERRWTSAGATPARELVRSTR